MTYPPLRQEIPRRVVRPGNQDAASCADQSEYCQATRPIKDTALMRTHHFTIMVLMILFFGCSDQGVNSDSPAPLGAPFTSSINGKYVACFPNQCFSLELDLNADGGYQWDLTIGDTSILRLDSTRYRPKSGNWSIEGGLTVETFYFRALHAGQSAIDLGERQEWMKDVPPISTVRFVVMVR